MANFKIFLVILFLVGLLYLGLEWLPYLFIEPTPRPELSPGETTMQEHIGIGFIIYFLILSALIYAKILLQRSHK